MAFSRKFQTVDAHRWKAGELKTSFIRGIVRRFAEIKRRRLDGNMWYREI